MAHLLCESPVNRTRPSSTNGGVAQVIGQGQHVFYVVAVGCHTVLSNKMFVCCFVRDDVNNTFVVIERAQWRMAMPMGHHQVRFGS